MITAIHSMTDFAFIQISQDRYLCGLGPFRSSESLDGESIAFYRNRFDLSDPRPWKIPAKSFETTDLRILLPDNGATPLPEIAWSGLGDSEVREVFDEILEQIKVGSLQKSVPVLTERGELQRGELAALVKALDIVPDALQGYGYRVGDKGMIGLSPETLFTIEDGLFTTMALAGTAPRHEMGQFPSDDKEIREHELVADYLCERLAPLGEVRRGKRMILDLGTIVHFLTNIQVRLDDHDPDIGELMALMHPTPALGACPRGDGALRKLSSYRERLKAPPEFGAPFGLWYREKFQSLVAIRHVSWDGTSVCLPSGVGLVRGSRFDREWRELGLKRNSVKALLGV
jgi:menaquinone-specific isochorismate synthase